MIISPESNRSSRDRDRERVRSQSRCQDRGSNGVRINPEPSKQNDNRSPHTGGFLSSLFPPWTERRRALQGEGQFPSENKCRNTTRSPSTAKTYSSILVFFFFLPCFYFFFSLLCLSFFLLFFFFFVLLLFPFLFVFLYVLVSFFLLISFYVFFFVRFLFLQNSKKDGKRRWMLCGTGRDGTDNRSKKSLREKKDIKRLISNTPSPHPDQTQARGLVKGFQREKAFDTTWGRNSTRNRVGIR